jgi:hypothetical protein
MGLLDRNGAVIQAKLDTIMWKIETPVETLDPSYEK